MLTGSRHNLGVRDLALLATRAKSLADPSPNLAEIPGDQWVWPDPAAQPRLFDAVADPGSASSWDFSPSARDAFRTVLADLDRWQDLVLDPVADLVGQVVADTGLDVEVALRVARGTLPTDSIPALIELAGTFDPLGDRNGLPAFLGWLDTAAALPAAARAPLPPDGDGVQLLTVHAAKGLEFAHVLIIGAGLGSFPSSQTASSWPTSPSALPHELIDEQAPSAIEDFPPNPQAPRGKEHDQFRAALGDEQRLDELRLGYVAMTRAERTLIVTGHRWAPPRKSPFEPGPLLEAARRNVTYTGDPWDTSTEPPDNDEETVAAVQTRQSQPPVELADESEIQHWDRAIARIRASTSEPERAVQVRIPPRLSVSAMAALGRDPQRIAEHWLRPMPAPASRLAQRGVDFHAWVEEQLGQLSLFDLAEVPGAADPPVVGASSELRGAFAESPFAARIPLAVEEPFEMNLAGRVVAGRIDAVYPHRQSAVGEPDGFEIVDWKTGTSADPVQLAIYALAWAQAEEVPLATGCATFVHVQQRRWVRCVHLPDRQAIVRMLTEPGFIPPVRVAEEGTW